MNGQRPIPLLGDVALEYVQRIEHWLDGGFAATRIAGLPGELQQRSNRPSHQLLLGGVLFGTEAASQLKKLQEAAANGEELTFAADISAALALQKVVITSFRAVEVAGQPGRYLYEIGLAESPPLPLPATVDPFGGLDDFGLGDLGFDTDITGDLQSLAGDIAGAVNDALEVVDQLSELASLVDVGGLSLGAVLEPLSGPAGRAGELASQFGAASSRVIKEFGR